MRRTRSSVITGIVAATLLAGVPTAWAAHNAANRTPASCTRDQLGVRSNGTNGAAGTVYGAWVFTNASDTTCTLDGYPDMQLFGHGGRPITTTVVQSLSPGPSLVTLQPGGSGTFRTSYSTVSASPVPCKASAVAQITAPNAGAALYIPAVLQPCGGVVNVSAVRAGIHHA
jgi:hypothetical protein